jgi:glyoxylase-like metal-dependent hydrolase (beta-lactamase superfamily II)
MQRWKIGDVTISRIVEFETPSSATFVLPDGTPENLLRAPAWLRPHFVADNGYAIMSVHAFVVESCGQTILVDTCIGNDKPRSVPPWNMRQGPFLQDLEQAGFPIDSIDSVLCTHLHVDHVGWNTRLEAGRWVPTFPGARYLVGRREWEYWSEQENQGGDDVIGDSVRPIFDAGLAVLVDSDYAVTDEVRLEPSPGHTPGHVSVHISNGGAEAVITGDLMHHPVQCARPDWVSSADSDANLALKTRRSFLERCAESGILVLGTHFATPTAGRIRRDGEVWRFEV